MQCNENENENANANAHANADANANANPNANAHANANAPATANYNSLNQGRTPMIGIVFGEQLLGSSSTTAFAFQECLLFGNVSESCLAAL